MLRFAVGHANLFDNDLIVEIIEAVDFRAAIIKHSALQPKTPGEYDEWLSSMPETMEEVKQFFFDSDTLVHAVEIPEPENLLVASSHQSGYEDVLGIGVGDEEDVTSYFDADYVSPQPRPVIIQKGYAQKKAMLIDKRAQLINRANALQKRLCNKQMEQNDPLQDDLDKVNIQLQEIDSEIKSPTA